MLLYVDKKQQKNQRIKRFCKVFFWGFVIVLNVVHFKSYLENSNKSLIDYVPPVESNQKWYVQADTVQVFAPVKSLSPEIIVIPERQTEENYMTMALAFSKIATSVNFLYFTPEIDDVDYLLRLAQVFNPQLQVALNSEEAGVWVTSDIKNVESIIYQKALYPFVSNYKHSAKLSDNVKLRALIEERYPTPVLPNSRLAKEQEALRFFVRDYQKSIVTLVAYYQGEKVNVPAYKTHSVLLAGVSLCISGQAQTVCDLQEGISLSQKIKSLLKKLPEPPLKLSLLTSMLPLQTADDLQKNDGVLFEFQNRQHILLPREKLIYATDLALLKQDAGINPDYDSSTMKFYKFKTVEINLNDNI